MILNNTLQSPILTGDLKVHYYNLKKYLTSIKNADNGKKIYSLNEKILMNPASVQKVLTTPVAVETLGNDYEFSTELYKRDENSYLIKDGVTCKSTEAEGNKCAETSSSDCIRCSDKTYLYEPYN